jgi:hypothetical protein
MTRTEIKRMQKELEAVAAKYGAIVKNSARYNSSEVSVSLKIATIDRSAPRTGVSESLVRSGLAPAGTRVVGFDGNEYTILSSRRVKYVVEAEDGKQYLIRFTAVRPAGVPA